MGKGNVCTKGDYEGLYYVDWCHYTSDECLDSEDFDRIICDFNDDMEIFKQNFKLKFSSFCNCNEWISRTEKAILESPLFYVVIEDNEIYNAIKLIQKEHSYGQGNIENLQRKHFVSYLNGIRDCLFELYEELGVYTSAWTHGTIYKKDYIK